MHIKCPVSKLQVLTASDLGVTQQNRRSKTGSNFSESSRLIILDLERVVLDSSAAVDRLKEEFNLCL